MFVLVLYIVPCNLTFLQQSQSTASSLGSITMVVSPEISVGCADLSAILHFQAEVSIFPVVVQQKISSEVVHSFRTGGNNKCPLLWVVAETMMYTCRWDKISQNISLAKLVSKLFSIPMQFRKIVSFLHALKVCVFLLHNPFSFNSHLCNAHFVQPADGASCCDQFCVGM